MRGYLAGELTPHPKVDFSSSEMLTEQHHKDEVDITTIVRRFGMTGALPRTTVEGVYGDFSGITDFETAREAVERAQSNFQALDSGRRDRFRNDPGYFFQLANHDPEKFAVLWDGPPQVDVVTSAPAEGAPGGSPPVGA